MVAEHIENIREQYKRNEGWLTPFPWREDFLFHLNDIYTRLRVVSKEKKARAKAEQRVVKTTEIFKPHEECEKPRKVLIEGKPGMGKTTYCNKVAYDWATKKLEAGDYFPEFELVLLLKCCDVGIGSDLWDAIDDQLLPREVQTEEREKFFNFISQNQSKVLLILDGLDEIPTSKLPKSFSEVISGKTLPRCYLVVTARHEAGIPMRKDCDTLLEVEGFSPEDAKEFILKYFEGKEDMAHALIDKLSIDSRLEELTYFEGKGDMAHDLLANMSIDSRPGMLTANPLNTALLCLLFEDFEGKLPQSRTQLYSEIVQYVLIRYRKRKGLPVDNDDLMELYKGQLEHLGFIALNSLREGTTHFEDKQLGSEHSDLTEFGFLSVQPGRSKRRPCFRYGFTHRSFQEFFAGYYLCYQLVSGEISPEVLVKDKRYFRELILVLHFTCGLLAVQYEEPLKAMIESIADEVNKEGAKEYFLAALEIIKDLPLKEARTFGSRLKVQKLDLSYQVIVELDLAVWVFCLLKTNKTLTHLDLTHNELGYVPVELLAGALEKNTTLTVLNLADNELAIADSLAAALGKNATLTSLDLSHNHLSDAEVYSLAAALETNRTLKYLNLSENSLGRGGTESLSLLFKTALKELVLTSNFVGPSTAKSIGAALTTNTTLTNLDMSVNELGSAGAESLADALKTNKTLTKLDLSGNNLGSAAAEFLGAALTTNTTLTYLGLSANNVGSAAAESLAVALKTNTTLTKLNLTHNNLGPGGAESLADALKTNTALTRLDLQFNNLGPASAESLASGFKTNTSMTELNLSYNALIDVKSLAAALETNRSLKDLNLSWNKLCPASADSLASSLKTNTTLTKLDLSGNNLGPAGAESLATALETNTTLKNLFLFKINISEAGRKKLNEAHGDRILFKCVDPHYRFLISYMEARQNTAENIQLKKFASRGMS